MERKNNQVHSFGRRLRNALRGQSCLDEKQPDKMPILQTVIFGIGAGLWLLCHMLEGIISFCSSTDISYGEMISKVDVTLYLLSIAIQVVFLVQYDGAILPNIPLFHYSIALMVADKVWVWLTVTLGNIGDILSQHEVDQLPMNKISNFSGNISVLYNSSEPAFYTAFEIASTFLEPFFIEFLTISMGVLLHLWNVIGKDYRNPYQDQNINELPQVERQYNDGYVANLDRVQLMARSCDESESGNPNQRNGCNLNRKNVIIVYMLVLLFFSLLVCSLVSLFWQTMDHFIN